MFTSVMHGRLISMFLVVNVMQILKSVYFTPYIPQFASLDKYLIPFLY